MLRPPEATQQTQQTQQRGEAQRAPGWANLAEAIDLTFGLRLEQESSDTKIDADGIIDFQALENAPGLRTRLLELATKAQLPLTQISQATILTAIQAGRIDPSEGMELGDLATLAGRVQQNQGIPVLRIDRDSDFDKNFSVFLPKLGLSYKVSPETRLYGTIQGGYRAGGAGASLVAAEEFEYDPEKTWNLDLGVRHQSADGRLRLGSNLFYVDWQDQQLQMRPEVATAVDFVTRNAGRSKSYGFELDADYQATERLRLFGSLGLLHTEITNIDEDKITSEEVSELVGNSFTMAPRTTVSAGWSYAFDHGLDFSMAANWRDSFFSDIENRPIDEVESRFLVDMGVGYQFPDRDLRLDLKVTNVFDERYLNYSYIQPMVGSEKYGRDKSLAARLQRLAGADTRLPQDLLALPTTGTGIVSPGDGRAVSLTLTARF